MLRMALMASGGFSFESRPVDLPHPASTNRTGDFVGAKSKASCKGHKLAGILHQKSSSLGKARFNVVTAQVPYASASN